MSSFGQVGILGAGRLTEALLEGMVRSTNRPVHICNRTPARIERLRRLYPLLVPVSEPHELAASDALVFLIVPPHAVLKVSASLVARAQETGTVLVSCANGLALKQLEQTYPGLPLIRALPNINWCIGRGVTLIQRGGHASDHHVARLRDCLGTISLVHEVNEDEAFERLGPLTSCGPGLVAEVLHQFCAAFHLADPREQALFLQTVSGTVSHMLDTGKSAGAVVGEVANPGGLTEVGVNALARTLPPALVALRDCMIERSLARREALTMAGQQ